MGGIGLGLPRPVRQLARVSTFAERRLSGSLSGAFRPGRPRDVNACVSGKGLGIHPPLSRLGQSRAHHAHHLGPPLGRDGASIPALANKLDKAYRNALLPLAAWLTIMRYIMPSKPPLVFPSEQKLLSEFGERIRLARLRRKLSAQVVATRAGISRMTLSRAEGGASSVTIGTYLRILSVLHLEEDLALMAADDKLGRRLQDLGLPTPRRASKRSDKT